LLVVEGLDDLNVIGKCSLEDSGPFGSVFWHVFVS
jgi:hypothetical protein